MSLSFNVCFNKSVTKVFITVTVYISTLNWSRNIIIDIKTALCAIFDWVEYLFECFDY